MGARKKISAEKRKEALKTMYFAKLQNVPTSPRKMRLVADMIRGMEVNRALGVLKSRAKFLPALRYGLRRANSIVLVLDIRLICLLTIRQRLMSVV